MGMVEKGVVIGEMRVGQQIPSGNDRQKSKCKSNDWLAFVVSHVRWFRLLEKAKAGARGC